MSDLPANVYRVPQRRFDAIPTAPWLYAVSDIFRRRFEEGVNLSNLGHIKLGISSVDMQRFYRFVWEIVSNDKWHALEKGGAYTKWYGIHDWVVNWADDGAETKQEVIYRYPYLTGNYGLKVRDETWLKKPGLTYTRKGGKRSSARILLEGNIFEDNGPAIFFGEIPELAGLAILNSSIVNFILNLISPGIDYQKGDLERLPFPTMIATDELASHAIRCCHIAKSHESIAETVYDFIAPPRWGTGLEDMAAAQARLAALEAQIDDEVYRLYGIGDEDRAAIEAELAGGTLAEGNDEDETPPADEDGMAEAEAPMTREELAVRWISYAVGIVLGRFQPGGTGELGSAIYRRADFAVGSLPAPDEAEFDELVGPPERFAYLDAEGGRHLFAAEVEAALRALAVPDGITVLEEGHPRDLPALVGRALSLMLGERSAHEVIAEGAGDDPSASLRASLRKFLERDFFTRWHLKWYRKRPVYWPLQSVRRSYGFVLFHERVDKSTLYVLQRDYLDHKLNGLRLEIGDLQGRLEGLSGSARKRVERQIDQTAQLLDEVNEFAETMERIVREGYEPAPDWIDDGVILRLAPLWELIPIWKAEPRKYWERLQNGDFDWSHIAMRYWPERVREACKTNKSFAIAHGREEWYEG